jgi:Ca2+-binding EF-hand superfamily protein
VLDFIKHQLASAPHYNPNLLFDLIAQHSPTITLQHLRNYLHDKLAVNERELYEIFERFDWTRQGCISREDFLNELSPFSAPAPPSNSKSPTLSAEIEGHFISLVV